MKKLFMSIAFVAITVFGIQAQSVDEILNSYYEAVGMEKQLTHNSMKITGKSIQMGMETPFTMVQKRPDSFRLEVDMQGGATMIQAFDGKTAWMVAPWTGSTDPVELSGTRLDAMKMQADFDGMLYDYADKGYTLELMGTDDMEGTEVYKLKFTNENGNVFYQFIDTENHILLKTTSIMKQGDAEIESETYFGNYKDMDGIIVPFSVESKMNGETKSQVIVETVEYDMDVDDSIFHMPETEKKEEPATGEKK
ncbi:MAG: outer membrane lipoprotein-sorting protein [Chlorobi bacterium]|nr:outer membrane lipoprotein-sorting protein [Chlorobiota bacterium]